MTKEERIEENERPQLTHTSSAYKIDEDDSDEEISTWKLITKFASHSVENVYSHMMQGMVVLISTIFAGHLGDAKMQAALGIGNSITFIFLLTACYGSNRAIEA